MKARRADFCAPQRQSVASDGPPICLAIVRARMICLPLNRRTALAMTLNAGPDRAVGSGASRARQINIAMIQDVERWIVHHLSDHPLAGVVILQPAAFTDETAAIRREAIRVRRELHRVIRRTLRNPRSDSRRS